MNSYFHFPYFFNRELPNQNTKKNAMSGIKESCKKLGLVPYPNFMIGNNIAIPKALSKALWTGVNFMFLYQENKV